MTDVPENATLIRLWPAPKFVGDDGGKLTRLALTPNTGDRKQAKERGHAVRVSVWDDGRTTLAQARMLTGKSETEAAAWRLLVADIRNVAAETGSPFRVVYDPLHAPNDPPDVRPGADGHVGIEGLEKGDIVGEKPAEWKVRVRKLVDKLTPYIEPQPASNAAETSDQPEPTT